MNTWTARMEKPVVLSPYINGCLDHYADDNVEKLRIKHIKILC